MRIRLGREVILDDQHFDITDPILCAAVVRFARACEDAELRAWPTRNSDGGGHGGKPGSKRPPGDSRAVHVMHVIAGKSKAAEALIAGLDRERTAKPKHAAHVESVNTRMVRRRNVAEQRAIIEAHVGLARAITETDEPAAS